MIKECGPHLHPLSDSTEENYTTLSPRRMMYVAKTERFLLLLFRSGSFKILYPCTVRERGRLARNCCDMPHLIIWQIVLFWQMLILLPRNWLSGMSREGLGAPQNNLSSLIHSSNILHIYTLRRRCSPGVPASESPICNNSVLFKFFLYKFLLLALSLQKWWSLSFLPLQKLISVRNLLITA